MKRLLNTLFVMTQGAWLAREGETVAVKVDGEARLRVPLHTLDGIICFGRVLCSSQLMETCCEGSVMITFASEQGRFLARVQGPVSGNVLLRRQQYRWADGGAEAADIARAMVAAKVANCRHVLLRAARDKPSGDAEPAEHAARKLGQVLACLDQPLPISQVRGREGEAANIYFGTFDCLISGDKDAFCFAGRSRRPPLDNVNAMLSFVYTLLAHDSASALEAVGLDPQVGFLHTDRPGRPGLALDLMEEFRAPLADRLVLSLINRRQVRASGFRKAETGGVIMDDDTRKTVLKAWQERKQEEIKHPFLCEKMAAGLLPYAQALLLARHLRGDLECYPPFIWK